MQSVSGLRFVAFVGGVWSERVERRFLSRGDYGGCIISRCYSEEKNVRWYEDIKTKMHGVIDGSEMERGVKD
jgi:hypothetical protein